MKLQKKGLLSDCEHLLTPLTTDQEGNLRGALAMLVVSQRMPLM